MAGARRERTHAEVFEQDGKRSDQRDGTEPSRHSAQGERERHDIEDTESRIVSDTGTREVRRRSLARR